MLVTDLTNLPMTATNYTVQGKQWRYKYFYQTCSNLHYFKIADIVICGRGKRSNTSHPWNTYQTEHLDLSKKCLSWLAVQQEGAALRTFCLNWTQLLRSPCWSVFKQKADSSAAPGQLCTCWPELTWKGKDWQEKFPYGGDEEKQQLGFLDILWSVSTSQVPKNVTFDKIVETPHDKEHYIKITNTVVNVRPITSLQLAWGSYLHFAC